HGSDDPEIPERNRIREPASLDKIIATVARTLGCDQRQIYESVRGRQNLARMLVVRFIWQGFDETDYQQRISPTAPAR
ncbi:MAG: hypothetical protein LC687_00500, partial [Actinobacteria bacterium]|nr:hypothetical protein [Actinomycetota bacterium]